MSSDAFDLSSTRRVVLIDTVPEIPRHSSLVDSWERKIVELKAEPVLFGHTRDNDVCLPSITVCRHLFEIHWDSKLNCHVLALYGPIHPPFLLNGEWFKTEQRRPLSVGDVITIGPFRIEYTVLKPLSEG
jgi:hypothetical protein